MKEEALKLADSIDEFAQGGYSYKPSDFLSVSAMIRRLVEELDKKPLSDEEIYEIWEKFNGEIKNFARAIEERHGIK